MPPSEPVSHFGGLVTRLPGEPWWQALFAGNTLAGWGLALALLVGTVLVLRLLVKVIAARVLRAVSRTATSIDDLVIGLLAGTRSFFIWAVALAIASLPLVLAPEVLRIGKFIVVAAVAVQAVLWGGRVVTFGVDWFIRRRARERGQDDSDLATSMVAVRFISLLALYAVVFIMAADNLGFDVTALVAGLGIGGIAVALAVQSILGDLFSSLSIVLDKPFVVGDFIIVGDKMGSVEYIGLKTTRLRALSGEQLIISNSDLLESRIHNYKRMQERRAVFTIGIGYSATPDMLERVAAIMRRAVEAQPRVRLDYAHFKSFGATGLEFEAVYWIESPEFNLYVATQERINLDIMRSLARAEIPLAVQSRTIVTQGGPVAPAVAASSTGETGTAGPDPHPAEAPDAPARSGAYRS